MSLIIVLLLAVFGFNGRQRTERNGIYEEIDSEAEEGLSRSQGYAGYHVVDLLSRRQIP